MQSDGREHGRADALRKGLLPCTSVLIVAAGTGGYLILLRPSVLCLPKRASRRPESVPAPRPRGRAFRDPCTPPYSGPRTMSTSRWKRRPHGSTWGDFGPDDQFGRMNLVTAEKVKQGIAEVREGLSFCLSLPLDYPGGNV